MNILGISGSLTVDANHDCSVAYIKDGKLLENCEEERFNRIKHSVNEFPKLSLLHILKKYNLRLKDIDAIGIPFDDNHREDTYTYLKKIDDTLDINKTKFFYKCHHFHHVLDSYYQSGFDHALAAIVDGSGDLTDGLSIYHVENEKVTLLKKYDFKQSLGLFYTSSAIYAGFNRFEEGKFMGLSSFGRPYELDNIYFKDGDIITPYTIDITDLDLNVLSEVMGTSHLIYCKKNCYPYKKLNAALTSGQLFYYVDFAASVQKKYNEVLLDVITHFQKMTGEENLILSGGCIQNCLGNEVIIKSGLFKNVFAAPAPHDAGCAAGLAFYAAKEMGEKLENKRLKHSYTGKTYSDEEILNACKKYNLEVEEYNQFEFTELLTGDNIAGWFQGGSEIGPRALGHRSIIANPENRDNLNIINDEIKHRETWRPLAPSVPAELFDKMFDTPSHDLCEFMLRTIEIRPEMRKKMIAVCHIDNTTRPQYLEREINPEYYDMIMEFYKKTGCPGVINTSFNERGEPIVETPEEAIEDFLRWDHMNLLVFNAKYIIKKQK